MAQVNLNGFGPVNVHLLNGTGARPTIAYVPAQQFVVVPSQPVAQNQRHWPAQAAGLPSATPQVRYVSAPVKASQAPQASSPGVLLSKGLCRDSTGENLATYFDHGRRHKATASAPATCSPKRLQPQPRTSILPQDLESGGLQPSSPRGCPIQVMKGVKHFTEKTEQLRHGPNPMDLPQEVVPHRRMVRGNVQEAEQPLSQRSRNSNLSSRLRTVSSDAAHRRSTGVWSCMESMSDGEANDRIGRRRLPHYSSNGAARGMQIQAEKPQHLPENPSGEESADGFPSGRKLRQRRHLQSPRESGKLVDGLSRKSPEEWKKVALGGKQRGRTNEQAQEYCRGGPGPWDQLPEGVVKKDAWGRLSPRTPPPHRSHVPWGTENGATTTVAPKVKRFNSAPPYGSDVDVPEPSSKPQSGFPLGMEEKLQPSPLFGQDGGSGSVPQIPEDSEIPAGTGEPRRIFDFGEKPRATTPMARNVQRSSSADSGRLGRSLLSSNFVDRQRATRHLRGGSNRLPSGGNLAHSSLLRPLSERDNNRTGRMFAGLKALEIPETPPNPQLEEAYKKCLESLRSEIEELQSRSTHLENEVHKTAFENGMMKVRPTQASLIA